MRYLGVDFGFKRIGLAISEGELASPLKIISVSSLANAVSEIKKESTNNKIDKIIVGLPEGDTGKAALRLANALKKEGLNVESSDETLSTKDALSLMIDLGVSRKSRKSNDAQAAALILQNYLDEQNK